MLESFDLDYCCGGGRTLTEACDRAGLDVATVVAELDALGTGPRPDWVPMSPALLVDHLESTHHAYLHAELPRLEALADKVAGVHGARHPELATGATVAGYASAFGVLATIAALLMIPPRRHGA